MKNSFLGIADQHGLRLLVPETEHAGAFLVRRAERLNAACFWVVIDDCYVTAVMMELDRGETRQALTMLQILAEGLGALLPSTFERAS